MAGLLTQAQGAMPPGPGAAPAPMPPGPGAAPAPTPVPGTIPVGGAEDTTETGEEKPNVSPEEQAQYDEFMNNAYTLIYSDSTFPAVLKRIKSGANPVESIANITATAVNRLKDSAEKSGKTISTDVLFQGGKELLEDLADMTGKAGIHDFTDKELESALYQALDLFRQMQGDDPQKQAAAQQDVATLKAAQANGTLNQLLPGIDQAAAQGVQAQGEGAGQAPPSVQGPPVQGPPQGLLK